MIRNKYGPDVFEKPPLMTHKDKATIDTRKRQYFLINNNLSQNSSNLEK